MILEGFQRRNNLRLPSGNLGMSLSIASSVSYRRGGGYWEVSLFPFDCASREIGSVDFIVGREVTGRINPALVSFLAGCQSKERLRLIDARSPIASTYLGTTLQITRVQYVRYERFVNKNTRVLWQVSVDVVWLLSSCLLIQLMKRKRVRWKQEMTPLGNEVNWLLQASTVTWKRVVDSKQKNRRC